MSGRASRDKGSRWEREVVRLLRSLGWASAERRQPGAPEDRGDVIGIPWLIEAKDHASLDLAGWITQAETARARTGHQLAIVIAKRRGHPQADDAYAIVQAGPLLEWLTDKENQ